VEQRKLHSQALLEGVEEEGGGGFTKSTPEVGVEKFFFVDFVELK